MKEAALAPSSSFIRQPSSFPSRLALLARDIKLSHSIFAMPWAILSAVMAWHRAGGPVIGKLILIIVCMIAARTVAMTANRLLDSELDRRNPRTAGRAIPSGGLSRAFALAALLICAIVFVAAAAMFYPLYRNIWPIALSIPVLAFLCIYPLLKRFTRLCHYYLGAALALAPICAWIAVAGSIAWPPIVMAGAVLCWTAGFDIIYACMDVQSDHETGIVSVPARFGIARALWISRATHAAAFALLVLLGVIAPEFSALYFLGVAIAGLLLVIEQSIVRPDDLSRVGVAFFTLNGFISLLIGALGVIDLFI